MDASPRRTRTGDTLDTILISMMPLIAVLLFALHQVLRRVQCPDCGDTLPILYSPFVKTRRMWRAGGYLCARCGCETDMAGRKITADTPPAPFPTLQWVMVAVLLMVGIGLGVGGLAMGRTVPVAAVAAPPIKELPIQAPVMQKVK